MMLKRKNVYKTNWSVKHHNSKQYQYNYNLVIYLYKY